MKSKGTISRELLSEMYKKMEEIRQFELKSA